MQARRKLRMCEKRFETDCHYEPSKAHYLQPTGALTICVCYGWTRLGCPGLRCLCYTKYLDIVTDSLKIPELNVVLTDIVHFQFHSKTNLLWSWEEWSRVSQPLRKKEEEERNRVTIHCYATPKGPKPRWLWRIFSVQTNFGSLYRVLVMILDIVQCFIMVSEVGVIKLTVRSLNCTCILDRKLRFLLTENQFFLQQDIWDNDLHR